MLILLCLLFEMPFYNQLWREMLESLYLLPCLLWGFSGLAAFVVFGHNITGLIL